MASAMGAVNSAPGSQSVTGTLPAGVPSSGRVPTLGTVFVTGAPGNYAYWRAFDGAWVHAENVMLGVNGNDRMTNDMRTSEATRIAHDATLRKLNEDYVRRAWGGRAVNSRAGATPYQYGKLGAAINDVVGTLAIPVLWGREVVDGGFEVMEGWIGDWKRGSQALVDDASNPWEAGAAGVVNALNQSFATLAEGAVGSGRILTNTDRLAEAAGGLEGLGSQRPIDTVVQVRDRIAEMSSDELLQSGLTTLVGLSMGAASGKGFVRSLEGGPSQNSGLSRTLGDWDELTLDGRPTTASRADDFLFSPEGKDVGSRKSHIAGDGSLHPANSSGATTPVEHVIAQKLLKTDSPYTSFSEFVDDGVRNYGDKTLKVDLRALRKDIGNGLLKDVEIIENSKLMKLHDSAVAAAQKNLEVKNNYKNRQALITAEWARKNSSRDHELLIRGIVPPQYLKSSK